MKTKIEGIAYEIDERSVTLEQDTGNGEPRRITLDRIHFEEIGRVAGWLPSPAIVPSPVRTEAMERDFDALQGRFYELFLEDSLMQQIVEKCPRGMEVHLHLRAIQTLFAVVNRDLMESRESRYPSTDLVTANQTRH